MNKVSYFRTVLFFLPAIILTFVFPLRSKAQFTEITGLAGYTLAETFNTTDAYQVYVGDGFTWGGSLAFYPDEHFDIALTYMRQSTHVDVWDYIYNSPTANNIGASVNYIMIGGDRNQPVGDGKAVFFGGLDLGTAGLVSEGNNYGSRWKFAIDLHIGAKIFPTPNVGIRMQAGLNMPIQYFGAAFTVGTGGSGAGVSAGSSITQVCFLGGLCFRIHPQ